MKLVNLIKEYCLKIAFGVKLLFRQNPALMLSIPVLFALGGQIGLLVAIGGMSNLAGTVWIILGSMLVGLSASSIDSQLAAARSVGVQWKMLDEAMCEVGEEAAKVSEKSTSFGPDFDPVTSQI